LTTPRIDNRGRGHPGWCKICAWEKAPEFNRRQKQGANAAQMQLWAKQYDFTFNRQVFYKHRGHITSARDKVVQAAAAIPERDKISDYSDDEVLLAIRDIGLRSAMDNPDTVNVGHALKAVQIRLAAKAQPTNVLVLIARAMTTPLDEIEGSFEDIGYDPPLMLEGPQEED
jgi:hypothetical protein